MIDFVVGAILVAVVGAALSYIIKSGKHGMKCIGCPEAKNCRSHSHTEETASGCGGDCKSCAGCSSHADVK